MSARVVLLTTNLARGGAESQVAQLALGLRRRGWEASVVSLLCPSAFESELLSAGVPVFSLRMRPGVPNPLGLGRLLARLRELRPQVLHSHMFHANLMARAARLLCPVPVAICTWHSLVESGPRGFAYRMTDPLADLTVAVCQAAAQRCVASRAVPPHKLRVVPNGIDTGLFRPDPAARAELRRQLGVGDEFLWLAVGRLMWKKDYPTMLRAFSGTGRGLLLVAGAGPQESELRAMASGLSANVRFLGLRQDISSLLNAGDGFVSSSVVEALPVALLEAASTGLPSVAAEAGGVREIVLDGRTGYLVPAGNPAALGAAMSRLISLPPEARRQMGQAAREHVVAGFDLPAVLAQWEQLYKELLGWT